MNFQKLNIGNKKALRCGRPKGAIGKTTKEARELYLNAIQGESEHIAQAFKDLREKDPYKYLQVIAKFTFLTKKRGFGSKLMVFKHK